MQILCAFRIVLLFDLKRHGSPVGSFQIGCCRWFTTANTDIFSPGAETAGTNGSLRERRHEHVVRLDEEELPTAAFIFMKVTVLEELRVFGVVAVAPLVEHVDAWTLGPLPSKQTIVPYSSDVHCSRFEEPRVRRAFVLWRAFAFIARTRLCALVERVSVRKR